MLKLSAEGTPFSGSRRGLQVDVAPDRAGDVAGALRDLVERFPDHSAIVPVLDTVVSDGRPYVVVASRPGEPLDVALRTYGPADIKDALPRLRQVASALDMAAAHGLRHGALTPREILISVDDTSLYGIGIADVLARQGLRVPLTPPYAAPELVAGVTGSPLADQYALASIAYEWLFGHGLGASTADDLEVPPLPEVDGDALRQAFSTALASDPAERFGSCTAFIDALDRSAGVPVRRSEPVARVVEVREFKSAEVPKFWGAAVLDQVPMHPSAVTEDPPAVSHAGGRAREPRVGAVAAVVIGGMALGALGLWLSLRSGRQVKPPDETVQTFTDAQLAPAESKPAPIVEPPAVPPPVVEPPVVPAAGDVRPAVEARPRADVQRVAQIDAGLLVHSTPAGAAVSIDGVERGTTPVAVRGLSLGTRTVTVTRVGYRPSERQITLTADRPSRTVEVGLVPAAAATPARAAVKESGLVVDSRPAGAGVSIDGRPVGATPLTVALPPGTYTVRIERLGYRAITTTVEVTSGQRARVAARLEGGQEDE